jgi:hypothetical protein
MRTIPELLRLMLENKRCFRTGLCSWERHLFYQNIITEDESILLHKYREENAPENSIGLFYWNAFMIEPRIDWINEQLKKFAK